MKKAMDLIEERVLDYDVMPREKMPKVRMTSHRRETKCKHDKCPVLYTLACLGRIRTRNDIVFQ
jgi:hypothetical protein